MIATSPLSQPPRLTHANERQQEDLLGRLGPILAAIEARDSYTYGHSGRVARLAHELASGLGLSAAACQEIYIAGLLHDVGKIGIPDQILLKAGKLSPDEMRVIQQHPEIGYRIVECSGRFQFALPGILYHHERIDGSGYPHRLSRDSIPLMARILAVADAYDAITSNRCYRTAMPKTKAVEILKAGAGSSWDCQIVDILCYRSVRLDAAEEQPLEGPNYLRLSRAVTMLNDGYDSPLVEAMCST